MIEWLKVLSWIVDDRGRGMEYDCLVLWQFHFTVPSTVNTGRTKTFLYKEYNSNECCKETDNMISVSYKRIYTCTVNDMLQHVSEEYTQLYT